MIIHGFAVAHAIACYLLHDTNFGDTIVLTCLTIAMVVVLTRVFGGPVEVVVGLLLLSSFAGFPGHQRSALDSNVVSRMKLILGNVLTTTLVTEILGWSVFFVVRRGKE